MSRIFNAQGQVVIDYDRVEILLEAHLIVAKKAGCRFVTVRVPTAQLLYLGNRRADAFAAMIDKDCEVLCSSLAKARGRRLAPSKS